MRNTVFAIMGLWVCVVCASVAAIPDEPKDIVEKASSRIFNEIKQDRVAIEADKARLYKLVKNEVLPHFNFARMARSVVKTKYWKKAPKDLRKKFIHTFRDYLVRTYSTALIKFEIEKIVYLPTKRRKGKSDVTVQTRVHLERTKPVPIDYRLSRTKKGQWKVFDIKVDGISLIINNRGSYNKILKKSGLTGLIEALGKSEGDDKKAAPDKAGKS